MVKKLLPDPDLEALIKRLNKAAGNNPSAASSADTETSIEDMVVVPRSSQTRWQLPVADEEASAG